MLFRPVRFAWTEPSRARFRVSLSFLQRQWKRVVLAAAALVALIWLPLFTLAALRGTSVHLSLSSLAWLGLSAGIFVLLFVGLSLLPISVRVYDDELVLDSSRSRAVPLHSISYCELTHETSTGRGLPVFNVYNRAGGCMATVLWDARKPIPELREILQSRQIELRSQPWHGAA